jgi:hypothetical protein
MGLKTMNASLTTNAAPQWSATALWQAGRSLRTRSRSHIARLGRRVRFKLKVSRNVVEPAKKPSAKYFSPRLGDGEQHHLAMLIVLTGSPKS